MLNIFAKITLGLVISSLFVSSAFAIGPKTFLGDMPEKAGSRPGLLKKIFNIKTKAAIGTCTVATIVDTTLTCTKDGTTYTILTDDKTQLRRRFWGKSSLSEILVGHVINVIGTWTDDTHTTIQARLVRDTSIQKRFGVFFGTVTSLLGSGWVMDTPRRGSQTVTVGASTQIVNRKEEIILQADVAVGHRVRVKGLWDSINDTITEVTKVKDFSLPPAPTVTATVTAAATPAATATPTP